MSSADEGRSREAWRSAAERPNPPGPKPWKLPSAWNIPDVAPDDTGDLARPLPALVSFHYLRRSVRRRWLQCLVPAFLGLLLAGGFLLMSPPRPTATTTLLLSHDERVDPSSAIATDITLLTTHTVAERTVQALGLSIPPEALMDSVTPVSTGSSEVLQLTMTGPTGAEAARRLGVFASVYLAYRADQVTAQSAALIAGYDKQIDDGEKKVRDLTATIQGLAAKGVTENAVSDAIAARAKANGQLADLQQLRLQAQLQQSSVVNASKVVDPPVAFSTGRLRRVVTVLASGLIAGLALGFVFVVLRAILSDRLWLRIEVASALEAPVPLSARRLAPLPWFLRPMAFVPRVRRLRERRTGERQLVAAAIERAARAAEPRPSVAVVCLGNAAEVRFAVIAAGLALRREGRPALIVDLSTAGVVASATRKVGDVSPEERPDVFRPDVVPSLTRGPADLAATDWDEVALAKARNAVTIVLADFDPVVGLDHLTTWVDDVIVAVTAGRSSVELVRTAGEMVRAAGLRLQAAMLLRAARDDVSSGLTRSNEEGSIGLSRPDKAAERPVLP